MKHSIHINEIKVTGADILYPLKAHSGGAEPFDGVLEGLIGFVDARHFGCRKHAGQVCCGVSDAAPEIKNSFRLDVLRQNSHQITYASDQEKMPVLSREPDPLIQHLLVFGAEVE